MLDMGMSAHESAAYAKSLAEHGFETRVLFTSLSIANLREDFNFKRGHLIAVEKFRSANSMQTNALPVPPAEAKDAAEANAAEAKAAAEARAAAERAALQSELEALTVKEVRLRAAAEGVDEDAIEDARDGDTPKESLIELILAKKAAAAQP